MVICFKPRLSKTSAVQTQAHQLEQSWKSKSRRMSKLIRARAQTSNANQKRHSVSSIDSSFRPRNRQSDGAASRITRRKDAHFRCTPIHGPSCLCVFSSGAPMPRPKIDPKDRKRSVRACVPCKASKVRCDSNAPCGRCSLKGRISACVYEPTNPQSRPRPSGHSHTQSLSQSTGNAEAGATTSPRSPQAAQSQSRMLLSSKGEKGDYE